MVSILTDSWESVQRLEWRRTQSDWSGFNPHRLLGVGATPVVATLNSGDEVVSILTDSWESVQRSRPRHRGRAYQVSILTDSWESVQRVSIAANTCDFAQFQSSPTPGSRCNVVRAQLGPGAVKFQSSPTPGSRCNSGDEQGRHDGTGFNPHRLLGVGATEASAAIC